MINEQRETIINENAELKEKETILKENKAIISLLQNLIKNHTG